jgi:hypothetical protein
MLYKTLLPISWRGERVEAGVEIPLTPEEFANVADLVVAAGETPEPEPTPEAEVAVADMTKDQLVAKAGELGLSTGGSKADLIERITLHLQGATDEVGS